MRFLEFEEVEFSSSSAAAVAAASASALPSMDLCSSRSLSGVLFGVVSFEAAAHRASAQAISPSIRAKRRKEGAKARQRFILSFPGSRSSFRATTSSTALAVSAPLLRPLEAFFDKRTLQLARGLSNSLQVSESSAERSSPSTSKAPKRSRDRSIAFKKNRNLLPLSLSLLPS